MAVRPQRLPRREEEKEGGQKRLCPLCLHVGHGCPGALALPGLTPGCSWYPEAEWERLYTCGIFSFWIFHCDDIMDANEEVLSQDLAASCRFRQQILAYARYWLGLD